MVLTRRRPARRNERGAILVLAAVLMTALMGMAAIAVDLANARQQHRQSQGSADAAALAAAQDLPRPVDVVATAKEYAAENHGVTSADWVGCQDPDPLPELPDLANSNTCISIDEAFSRVRVMMPVRQVETYFARVLGVRTVDVRADATAEAKLRRDDRIIPATVAAATGSGLNCIEAGGSNVGGVCSGASTTGNFGSFDAPRLNIFKTSNTDDTLRINYSMGVDHVLSIYGTGSPRVCDFYHPIRTPCSTTNVASGLDANHIRALTGNTLPPLTDGLVRDDTISTDEGNQLFCGRLRRPDLTDANLTLTDPEGCEHWRDTPGPGPRIQVQSNKWINGRHVAYWMFDEFRTEFFGSVDPMTTPVTSSAWGPGNDKLACFLSTYRFDYAGPTERFIDPRQPIDTETADGVTFPTLEEARAYLVNDCGLRTEFVEDKLASLTDGNVFWPMFDNEAIADPRFGMIPVVKEYHSGGSTAMQIVRFWATYVNMLDGNNNQVQSVDAWVFEPALIETESGVPDLQFGFQTDQAIVRLVD